MSWLQCIFYGAVMGISEFLPVSSAAQRQILNLLFGINGSDAVLNLIVHVFSFAAFLIAWKKPMDLFLNPPVYARSRNRYRSHSDIELRFIRAAVMPMLLVMLLSFYISTNISATLFILLLILNGILLYLPDRILQGNKTARMMSTFDAWIIGAASALCVVPGFSRLGMCISVAQMRGTDRKHALDWAYMLSVPAILLLICADLVGIIFGSGSLILSANFLGYLLVAIFSFGGSFLATYFMRNVIIHRGLCAYAYYSWGSALFVLILYLL